LPDIRWRTTLISLLLTADARSAIEMHAAAAAARCPIDFNSPLRCCRVGRSSGAKTVAASGAAAKDTNYFKNKKPWDV
jgi:hypothetical protein